MCSLSEALAGMAPLQLRSNDSLIAIGGIPWLPGEMCFLLP